MKVPINPETRVPTGQLGYERAVDVSSGTRALGEVVSKYAQYAEEENKKRELFDVQKRLVDETNNIQQDFEDKTNVEKLGAPNFTQRVNGEYNTRHQDMVKELKTQGYSDEAVQEFATRLGSIRATYVAKAIDFQEKSNLTKAGVDSADLATSLSQYANNNPNALPSALEEYKTSLTHLGLNEIEQAHLYEQNKGAIIKGAQEGFAVQHPEVVLGMYGFPHELTTTSPPTLPHGQQFDLPSYMLRLGPTEGTKKNPKSSAVGFGQFLKETWIGTYKEVFGKTNESEEQILAKRKNLSIATKLTERLTQNNIKGLAAADAPINSATVYLAHFLGLPDALKVIAAHADKTIKSLVHGASIAANPTVFKKIENAGDMIAWAQKKMGGETQVALKPIPANWRGNQEDAIQELGMTADQAATFLTTGKDTRGTAPTTVVTAAPPTVNFDAQGQSGIPVIDLSSGPERMQMLTLARTVMNAREADAKASQSAAHEEWLNGFLNKLQDGKLGQVDLDAAYNNGQLTDFDERKKAQAVIDSKIKKEDDLARFHMMLQSGQKFNPYDPDAQKAADAGFDNAVKYDEHHGGAAGPFMIALRTWQRTGILPKQGGIMIRGGLIGTDPNQVAAAASVASNMLVQNSNAFAGVEGGEDIGKAAATYTHYVDDLGMSAQDAANKIATMNSPEFQAKAKAGQPEREAFVDSITGSIKQGKVSGGVDIEKVVNDSIFGKRGWGSTVTFHAFDPVRGSFAEPQKAEARQTYLELALDHYDKYHDATAAQDYASRQMSRFYGSENGRLLKFPATKAYPEINGTHEYIFDQAKTEVDKFAGFAVDKNDIFLQPTSSGSTAAAFRAGKPPPYEVHFITRNNGQAIYHTIPGSVFVADVEQGRREAAIAARKVEQAQRAKANAIQQLARRAN